MRPRLLGIGTATPALPLTQEAAAAHAGGVAAARDVSGGSRIERTVRALYRRAGVQTRGSVLSASPGLGVFFGADGSDNPTTAARMAVYERHAGGLALAACDRALRASGVDAGAVTHVVTASCTGFEAPGVDQFVIRGLGLAATVRRTNVGFMGCHAAINALAVASAFAAQSPGAVVLVCCVELCSLHFSYDADPEKHVANALFADGAAAAVVGAGDASAGNDGDGGKPTVAEAGVDGKRTAAKAAVEDSSGVSLSVPIAGFASTIIPGTSDLMRWSIGDHGFAMRLSSRVPDVLADAVPAWVDGFLAGHGLTRGDVGGWAIHPGGPRVLSAVGGALGLPAGEDGSAADGSSRAVLAAHGNVSSATVLFILARMLDSGSGWDGGPVVAMAFGPGLAGEGMLLGGG